MSVTLWTMNRRTTPFLWASLENISGKRKLGNPVLKYLEYDRVIKRRNVSKRFRKRKPIFVNRIVQKRNGRN